MFKNLDGAFEPRGDLLRRHQAARLGMPEAMNILGRVVDAGYSAAALAWQRTIDFFKKNLKS